MRNYIFAGFRFRLLLVVLSGFFLVPDLAADDVADALRARAAGLYSERAYEQAHKAWQQLAAHGIPEAERPKLDFFIADSLWRSQSGREQLEEARGILTGIVENAPESALAAEAWESLGDSWLASDRDWPRAWEAYQEALAYWAGSTDSELARERYLGIVWKATGPPTDAHRVALVPLEVLNNALRIARSDENVARARFFLGVWLSDQGDPFSLRRAGSEWSQVIAMGSDTAVYESALFRLAQWALVAGSSDWQPDGSLEIGPNSQRAFGLFKRFLAEFPVSGDSIYSAEAAAQIAELTRSELSVSVDRNYLPGSEPLVVVEARNVPSVEISLYRVDLLSAFQPQPTTDPDRWDDAIRISDLVPVRQWTHPIDGEQPLEATRAELSLEMIEEPGTYVLEAGGAGLTARTLILVSTTAAVFKSGTDEAVAMICDVGSGRAYPDATATLWQAVREDAGIWKWTPIQKSDRSGALVHFVLPADNERTTASLVLLAEADQSPAHLSAYSSQPLTSSGGWRTQVITDRRFCIPGDSVEWKLTAREMENGRLLTPAGEIVEWRVLQPSGDEVARGEVRLTDFGGAWGRFQTDASHQLGEFSIEFYARGELIGEATVFELDEPKRPAFAVSLGIPGQTGRTVRLGETLRVRVQAEYLTGGGVPDAVVAVTVRESPFQTSAYAGGPLSNDMPAGGVTRILQQSEMRTAPNGSVVVEIPTPPDSPVDLVYDVDVVVRDASGREIPGQRQFVVARQGYFAHLSNSKRLVLPDSVSTIFISTRDANDTPVPTSGTVAVSRETWAETWSAPDGRDVTGAELDTLRQAPFPPRGERDWQLKSRDVTYDEVQRLEIETDSSGRALFNFQSPDDGLYRISWESSDGNGPPVTGETRVWVSSDATRMLEFRAQGLRIIADPQVPPSGLMNLLIVTDTTGRDVLLTAGAGQELYYANVERIEGDARFLQLQTDARFSPNVFLQAALVRGGEFFSDSVEIKLPNSASRLDLTFQDLSEITSPGATDEIRLQILNAGQQPVVAEVALAVVNQDAVPISDDIQLNPLEIFHGGLRVQGGPLVTSLNDRKTVFETQLLRETRQGSRFAQLDLQLPFVEANVAGEKVSSAVGVDALAGSSPISSLRADRRPVALWAPGIRTSSAGLASVAFEFPNFLAKWRVTAWAASSGESFGFNTAVVAATSPLVAEILPPPFLLRGDRAEIRSTITNGTTDEVKVRAALSGSYVEIENSSVDRRVRPGETLEQSWLVTAVDAGVSDLELSAKSGNEADLSESQMLIGHLGQLTSLHAAGVLRQDRVEIAMELPADQELGSTSLSVNVSSSLASVVLDALPSLVGMTPANVEQVASKFAPLASAAERLASLGMSRERLAVELFDVDDASDVASARMPGLINRGLQAVYDQQLPDGAWAWCKGGASDTWMTAYVVWSLRKTQTSGVGVREDKLESGVNWLRASLADNDQPPALKAWILHVISTMQSGGKKMDAAESAVLDALWSRRSELSAEALSHAAIAAHRFGQNSKATGFTKLLADQAIVAGELDGQASEVFWDPGDDAWHPVVETTSLAVMALSEVDAKNPRIQAGISWLIQNRVGADWGNSRATSFVLSALDPYVDILPAVEDGTGNHEVQVNGVRIAQSPQDLEAGPAADEAAGAALRPGRNVIAVRRIGGDLPIYYSAKIDYYRDADPVVASPARFGIQRDFSKLVAEETLLDGWKYNSVSWYSGDSIPVNTRIQGVLTFEAAADSTYVQIDDSLAAGLEPVDIQSGSVLNAVNADGRNIPVFADVGATRVIFQIPKLPQGSWELRYQLRAAVIGEFSRPPATISAEYSPGGAASTPSWRLRVEP